VAAFCTRPWTLAVVAVMADAEEAGAAVWAGRVAAAARRATGTSARSVGKVRIRGRGCMVKAAGERRRYGSESG